MTPPAEEANTPAAKREAAIAPLVKAGMTREEAIALIRAAIRRASS